MKTFLKLIFMISLFLFFSFSLFAVKKALLVGIADYKNLPPFSDKGKTDLRGPLNDVRLIKKGLISYYGFSEDNIKVLTNHNATRQNIEKVFREWFINGSTRGDTLVFYFSGHGSRVTDFDGDEKEDNYDEALLPFDMVPYGGANIILDDELGRWLNQLKERHVVVIADCCHSGGTVRGIRRKTVSVLENIPSRIPRVIPITGYQPSSEDRDIPKGVDIPEPVVFLAASLEDQKAYEINLPGRFQGGFTYGIFEGMKNLKNPSYKDMFNYAKHVVRDRLKLAQDPLIAVKDKNMLNQPFLLSIPTSLSKRVNRPIVPPEILGEKVRLAVEHLKGGSQEEMKNFKQNLFRLPIIELVNKNAFFDRLIRGEKKNGMYHIRLINGIGDVEKIKPAASIKELIDQTKQHIEYAYMVKQLARIYHPTPSFKVNVWVTDETRRDFYLGEKIVFGVKSEKDCYVLLINLDSKGNVHIIFPNKYHKNNCVRANTPVLIPDKAMSAREFQLEFGPPVGEETVKVIATSKPLDLRNLGIRSFRETFQTLSGKEWEHLLKMIIRVLSANMLEWSEDTVVIRSHKREQN